MNTIIRQLGSVLSLISLLVILITHTSNVFAAPCVETNLPIDTYSGGSLRPASGKSSDILNLNDRNIVVLIHGWNPKNYQSHFDCGDWASLIPVLEDRLQGTEWKLQLYDWSRDAATGPPLGDADFLGFDFSAIGIDNAIEAASNGWSNGEVLADEIKLKAPDARKITVIAHSAGSWAARRAVEILITDMPYLTANMVLLDPYIPDAIVNTFLSNSLMESLANMQEKSDRIFRLENYHSVDDRTSLSVDDSTSLLDPGTDLFYRATSQVFNWEIYDARHIDPVCVNSILGRDCPGTTGLSNSFTYDGHGAPIQFYTDSILATQGQIPNDYLSSPWYDPNNLYGFSQSLIWDGIFLPSFTKQLYLSSPQSGNAILPGLGAIGTVFTGEALTMTVETNRAETYQWYKDEEILICGTECTINGSSLTIHSASLSDIGEYVVRAGNDDVIPFGYTFSDKLTLQIIDQPAPIISDVSPQTLIGLPLPGTQLITITGVNFQSTSRLIFTDGTSVFSDIVPNFVSSTQLTYNIAVGVNPATWTVSVSNNGVQSAPFEFYVESGPQPPSFSPSPNASDGTYSNWTRVTWNSVSDATSYGVYRCTGISTSTCTKIASRSSTSYDDDEGDADRTYYYRLKACNANGCDDDYSGYDLGHRGSEQPPTTSSINASDGLYTNGVVVFWPPVSGADYYQIQRAQSLNGSRSTLSANFAFTTFPDTQATPGVTYYYWVRSCSSGGVCSDYGNPDSGFRATSEPSLSPAINPEPSNGANNVSVSVNLDWSNGGGAERFRVFFGEDQSPDSGEEQGTTFGTSYNLLILDCDTDYYWRIDSINSGVEQEGTVWSFTTEECSPDEPDLIVQNLSVSNTSPFTNERFDMNVTVRNNGDGDAELTTTRYYRSNDSTISPSDTEIDNENTRALSPGEVDDEDDTVSIDTAGTFWVGACVDAVSGEEATSNNCTNGVQVTVTDAQLDLAVTSTTLSDSTPYSSFFEIFTSITNIGSGEVEDTILNYYLSVDETITDTDILIGTDSVDDANLPGSINNENEFVSFNMPGTYWVGGCTEPAFDEFGLTEVALEDNCSEGQEITIPSPASTNILGKLTRESVSTEGYDSNSFSRDAVISRDGRYITFRSESENLVLGDTNDENDIFVRDVVLGITERVSITTTGGESDDDSLDPTINSDGRYVTFRSEAALDPSDSNNDWDIYVRDRISNTTQLITKGLGGADANDGSDDPIISDDGRYVAFESSASNLVSNDNNGEDDIFRYDMQTGQIALVSTNSSGIEGNDNSFTPSISGDGRYIVFRSRATNLIAVDNNGSDDDIFVKDMDTGAITLASVDSNGIQSNDGSREPNISSDGRYVVFHTPATNLVPGDNNGVDDVFLRDLQTNTTTRVSVNSEGEEGNDRSTSGKISNDGLIIVFDSSATNLIENDNNGIFDTFIRDRGLGVTKRISQNIYSIGGDAGSNDPSISGDGTMITFNSTATNLIENDLNGIIEDVFLYNGNAPQDFDGDGLTDAEELTLNTDPNNLDSDGDGLTDGEEINNFLTDPMESDSDSDGLSDLQEINFYMTNPNDPDIDSDGLTDGQEVSFGTDFNSSDTDGDGLLDGAEIDAETNPFNSDTDGDGVNDGDEVASGTDPNDPASVPVVDPVQVPLPPLALILMAILLMLIGVRIKKH